MANSSNKELAYAFINYMYRPEVSAANMNDMMYMAPHKEAVNMVDESLLKNPAFRIPEDVRKRCIPLDDLGENNSLYVKAWDRIRAD